MGKLSLQNLRELLWLTLIIILWLTSQSTQVKLAQLNAVHDHEMLKLKRIASNNEALSRDLVAKHCNLTALSHKIQTFNPPAWSGNKDCPPSTACPECEKKSCICPVCASSPNKRLALPSLQEHPTPRAETVPAPVVETTRRSETIPATAGKWLVLGIPTVPRVNNENFLGEVVESIISQLPSDPSDSMYGQVLLVVVNMHENVAEHQRFHEARVKYGPGTQSQDHVHFADYLTPLPEPTKNKKRDAGSANRPGFKVRKQTRDIAVVLKSIAVTAKYFMFLEDDMTLCANGILNIRHLLERGEAYSSDWIAIRASFGMNGIFMRGSDLPTFANYLVQHQARRPPDHLVVEWFAGEVPESAKYKKNRAHFGFRYNLFEHLGKKSTLRSSEAKEMPMCYETLSFPILFMIESFKPDQCPMDDLWPCPKTPVEPWVDRIPDQYREALKAKALRMKNKKRKKPN